MGIIAGLLAMFFWGTAIFLAAIASRKIGNILTLFWMQLFGLALGTAYFLLNFQSFNLSLVSSFIPVLIIIAILQIIAYLSFYKGLEKGQVSLVSPLGASWGLIVAILGVVVYNEVLSSIQLIAILLIVAGIILISIDIPSFLKSKKVTLLTGVKEGIISMFGWGVALFLLVAPTRNLNWFLPAFVFRFFLLILLGMYIAYLKEPLIPQNKKFPLLLLMTIGIFDMLAFMAFSFGLSSANASLVAPIASAFTVVTIVLARLFLKEKVTQSQFFGISSVVLGLILISL